MGGTTATVAPRLDTTVKANKNESPTVFGQVPGSTA